MNSKLLLSMMFLSFRLDFYLISISKISILKYQSALTKVDFKSALNERVLFERIWLLEGAGMRN